MTGTGLTDLLRRMPKAELHLHIEGTLGAERMLALAERNAVALPYEDADAIRAACDFTDLQSFLDLYYAGADVLRTAEDFHDLMADYLANCRATGIVHAEIMFDPQTHTARGIPFAAFMEGFGAAIADAGAAGGPSVRLLMSFLRHLDEADAFATLEAAAPFREHITAVGLDSGEQGNPPTKFARVFAEAGRRGYRRIAHAGEEGPAAWVRDALDVLGAERIDHGVRALDDDALVDRLVRERVPLTVCPLSNVKLRVVDRLADHPILAMLDRGLAVSVHSDDPAYFGGDLLTNLEAMVAELDLDAPRAIALAENAITASFLDDAAKARYRAELAALAD